MRHLLVLAGCISVSVVVNVFILPALLPETLSLILAFPVGFAIGWIGYDLFKDWANEPRRETRP